MLDVILFDLDGTLIDTIDLIVGCWQHATHVHCGAPIPREQVLPTIGLPLAEALEAYAPGQGPALWAAYQDYNAEWHDRLALLVPGTREMLGALKAANRPLGVVTSKRHPILRRGLDLFALGPFFDLAVAFEDTGRHKPAADPVLFALERLGRLPDPNTIAYVGDAPSDLACAQAAGVRPIGVPWGATPPAQLAAAGARPVLTTWDELLAIA
jgi:pyrophosphatase PpaX